MVKIILFLVSFLFRTIISHYFIMRDTIENEILNITCSEEYQKYQHNRTHYLMEKILSLSLNINFQF